MVKEQLAVYELLRSMIRGKTGHLSKAPYLPQKPPFSQELSKSWSFPRVRPEERGISSRRIEEYFRALEALEETDIHGALVLRGGAVIGECSFAPYRNEIWHIGHSLCKSITGMAIGLLIQEGKLDLQDRVGKIFERRRSLFAGMRQKNLTVEHLLTMTSQVTFKETGIVSGEDWVKGYLDAPASGNPGSRFDYNSMNSYMLSAIVTEITGESMAEYLKPRLFGPMGIRDFFWEACPRGITKGGWGLFLRPEDAAKFGQLYLDGGSWRGEQLIPREWVEASTSKKVDTPEEMSPYGYGYQIWMGGREGSFLFNGMLGQNVVVYPDLDMVLVTNAGSNELFPNSALMEVVRTYFEGDFAPPHRLSEDPVAWENLKRQERRFGAGRGPSPRIQRGGWNRKRSGISRSWQGQMRRLDGNFYRLERQQAGLFPLIMQVFHNNFTDGISRIGFQYEDGKGYLLVREGNAAKRLELGFEGWAENEISLHGESYRTAVSGRFAQDEDQGLVLKVEIAFLEEAARRKIKIFFREDTIRLEMDETPGKELIQKGLGGLLKEAASHPLLNGFREMTPLDLPELLVEQTIHPVIYGKLEQKEGDGHPA